MRISDWSSDVCSSDLPGFRRGTTGSTLAPMAMRAKWRRVGRPLLKGLGALVLVPLLYFLAVAIGGTLTANADWREPDEGVTLLLRHTGVHTRILVPQVTRPAERRVRKECVRTCKSTWTPAPSQKKPQK